MLRKNLLSVILIFIIIVMGIEIIYLVSQNRQLRLMAENPKQFYTTLKQNDQVIPFAGKDINGNQVAVEYSQNQPYRVMFWFSSTCHACEDNLNFWNDLYRDYNSDKLQLIGISGDDPVDVQTIISDSKLNFPVICLDDQRIIDAYKGNVLPQTLVVTPIGFVEDVLPGSLQYFQKNKLSSLLKNINSLISERR